MSQDAAVFGDLDVQQSSEQEEAEFGALELQQAQILFSALKAIQTDAAYMRWADEAAAEIEARISFDRARAMCLWWNAISYSMHPDICNYM